MGILLQDVALAMSSSTHPDHQVVLLMNGNKELGGNYSIDLMILVSPNKSSSININIWTDTLQRYGTHTFMTYFVVWRVRKATSSDVTQTENNS